LKNKFRTCFEVEFLAAAVQGINKKKQSQSFVFSAQKLLLTKAAFPKPDLREGDMHV